MSHNFTDAMLEASEISKTVNEVLDDHPEHARQSKFFALIACATEQAILMEQDTPGIFAEHGGRDKWVHDMTTNALKEMQHGIAARGKPKN